MAVPKIGEIQRFFRQTLTREGREEKKREGEMKTYQAALAQFNQALAPFEEKMRALHLERGVSLIPNKKESYILGIAPYTSGKITYTDLRIVHSNGAFLFTATVDTDDWVNLSSSKRTADGGPKIFTDHNRRVKKVVLAMDESTGELTSAQSGNNISKLSRFDESLLRIKYPVRFKNALGCVDSLKLKPVTTIPDQTAAVKIVTELLQKAQVQKRKKK